MSLFDSRSHPFYNRRADSISQQRIPLRAGNLPHISVIDAIARKIVRKTLQPLTFRFCQQPQPPLMDSFQCPVECSPRWSCNT